MSIGKCCAGWNKRVKNFSYHDIKHIKLASIAFALFMITVWPGLHNLVMKAHWGWYLAAFVLFSIRPFVRFWKKK